jgi:hypothetical protein
VMRTVRGGGLEPPISREAPQPRTKSVISVARNSQEGVELLRVRLVLWLRMLAILAVGF